MATCVRPSGGQGSLSLNSAPQPVLYLVGGSITAPLSGAEKDSGISRLRIADKQWDGHVTALPYEIYDGALGGNGEHLFMAGGQQTLSPTQQALKCDSDIPGCTGAKCPNGCIKPGGIACPKESVAKPELGTPGCGTIWRLDLADASWHAVGALAKNESWGGLTATIGNNLYITLGMVLDMTTGLIGPMPVKLLAADGASVVGEWLVAAGGTLLTGGYSAPFYSWKPGQSAWQPFAPTAPCPDNAGGIKLGGFEGPKPTFVWTALWGANIPDCPKGSTVDITPPIAYRTWLSTGGDWKPGPTLPVQGWMQRISWPGGVFFVPVDKPTANAPTPSTWLLASPGDHFEEFPPPPVDHGGTVMAVVVTQ